MQADPLQQLKDIHVPQPPGWWPPAPGWWLVLLLLAAAAAFTWIYYRRRQRARLPLREAKALYNDHWAAFNSGSLNETQFINATNEVLKRALIFTQQNQSAITASGEPWLNLLDNCGGTTNFSEGPGQVLGDARFAPQVELQPEAFHAAILSLLGNLRRD